MLVTRGNFEEDSLGYLLTSPTLGSSFIRLGIYQTILPAISQISNVIDSKYILCKLYNLLGSLMESQGNIKQAIYYHQKSGDIAQKLLTSDDVNLISREYISEAKIISIVYLSNIGICMADLWKIEEAIFYLEKACNIFKENNLHSYEIRAWGNLASLYSLIENLRG